MAVELKLPPLGENVDTGDVVKLLVAVGATVRRDDPILELETGKATVEVPASAAGRVTAIHVEVGQKIKVGQLLVTLDEAAEGAAVAQAPAPVAARIAEPEPAALKPPRPQPAPPVAEAAQAAPKAGRSPVMASPSVRQFAREIGVDIYSVPGSGPGGRISEEDVKQYARRQAQTTGIAAAAPPGGGLSVVAPALPDFTKYGKIRREAMSTVRLMTAQQMSLAWANIPMVTHYDYADTTELERQRKQLAAQAEAAGVKLTVTAVLLKFVAAALRKFPKFNAGVDIVRREVVFKEYVNIGVAVDTERGLLVPVIRDADRKGLIQLARELGELSQKARDRKLGPDALEGGNFTLTNLGGLGVKHFAPIINYPEVAILGVGRAATEPVYIDGQLAPRLRLPLSLTYDHRVIDGADGARFMRWLIEALESPLKILLEE
jgi:pyruvate dehydrogenase E2 component (dihydrolipoamide acetyltransferase)